MKKIIQKKVTTVQVENIEVDLPYFSKVVDPSLPQKKEIYKVFGEGQRDCLEVYIWDDLCSIRTSNPDDAFTKHCVPCSESEFMTAYNDAALKLTAIVNGVIEEKEAA